MKATKKCGKVVKSIATVRRVLMTAGLSGFHASWIAAIEPIAESGVDADSIGSFENS
jgi:hypothetical protein